MPEEKRGTNKKLVPIAPYLRLPESDEDEATLIGSRCRNCGEVYLDKRMICIKCYEMDQIEEISLSRTGELFTYTVVHHSVPWVELPYVAAIVKLPEGPILPATMAGCEPDPAALRVGMPVKLVTEIVRQDEDGNDVVAFKFKPV